MAKLILAKNTAKLKGNNKNDVIDIFEDDHIFSIAEQQAINNGLYSLVSVPRTKEEVIKTIEKVLPPVKRVWFDPTDSCWKELAKEPQSRLRYVDGEFLHNYGMEENQKKLNG